MQNKLLEVLFRRGLRDEFICIDTFWHGGCFSVTVEIKEAYEFEYLFGVSEEAFGFSHIEKLFKKP